MNTGRSNPDHALPASVIDLGNGGSVSIELTGLRVRMTARVYPEGHEAHFHAHLGNALLEVFHKAAHALEKPLLPPAPASPLDLFRMRLENCKWSDPISDLELPLWKALADGFSRHTSVEYRLVISINTKWGLASSSSMTPKALLAEFGFNHEQFSLYRPHSNDPLPPDVPIDLTRGEHFEAQKDGRYGFATSALKTRGFQTIEEDAEALRSGGLDVTIQEFNSQKYALVRNLQIPSPPWSIGRANILVAVPATYPQGGLDAFYLEPGPTQNGGVPRKQSDVSLLGRTWSLISWHYTNNRPWDPRVDDLGTHIEHCRGFFLARGVGE